MHTVVAVRTEVRGSVTDRPWGVTLGDIALRRHTGQLTIESDGKRYSIAFEDGAIVAASSPLAADAITRIALTNHFITSTQVTEITRRLARWPDRDEVEVLAATVRCSPQQILKLRHRIAAQRAARTFSLERGDFVLEDHITLPVFAGVAVDHRHVIYLGAQTNLSEQRLLDDLRQLGSRFVLRPEAIDELPRFGFDPSTHPVIEALEIGTSLPELEALHREIDPRSARAIIYALVSCNACAISSKDPPAPVPSGARTTPSPAGGRRLSSPYASRARIASPTAYSGVTVHYTGTNTPAAMRPPGTAAADAARPRAPIAPAPTRLPVPAGSSTRHTPASGIPTRRTPPNGTPIRRTPPDGTPTALAWPAALPDTATPPRTARTDTGDGFAEQRTPGFAEQRTPGFAEQRTPNPQPSRVSTDTAVAAEQAFQRGELAMKRDQPAEAIQAYKTACELNPDEVDYAGMLAWAKFCAASDKATVSGETRKILERTAHRSPHPERARFYLGRVERMLGRDREALRHFQEVLELKPNHAEAASEVRAIEARLQAAGKPGTGLFGRKHR